MERKLLKQEINDALDEWEGFYGFSMKKSRKVLNRKGETQE